MNKIKNEKGIIIVVVMWIMVIMGIIGLAFHNACNIDLNINQNLLLSQEVLSYAEAGIEAAKAEIRNDSTLASSLNDTWHDNDDLYRDISIGRGYYRLVYDKLDTDTQMHFGVLDEASKLNVNTANEEMLMALPNMEESIAQSILDWRDQDEEARPQGAEADYYYSLPEPYHIKNNLFDTLEELLLVKGVEQEIFYGEDVNQNGVLDKNENDGDSNYPPDNIDGKLDRGLSRYLTIYSNEKNVDGSGGDRLNINEASEADMKNKLSDYLTDEEIKKIIEYRDSQENKPVFGNIGDLLAAKTSSSENQNNNEGNNNNSSQSIISKDKFIDISDKITVTSEKRIPGRININTASDVVLKTVFRGDNESLVDKIKEYREGEDGPFESLGELLKVDGVTESIFKDTCAYLTVHSYVFHVLSYGYLEDQRAVEVVQTYIDKSYTPFRVLYWKEGI